MGECASQPGIDTSLKTLNTSSKKTVEYADFCVSKPTSTSSKESITSFRKKNMISEVCANELQLALLSDSIGKVNLFSTDIFCKSNSGSQSIEECDWSTDSRSELSVEEIFSFDGLNMRATNRCALGLKMLKAKIHHGANPKNLITHGDRSCIMFSVIAEDFAFVKKLVELGVNVNETNSQGENAWSFLINLERHDIASYLQRKGALGVVELAMNGQGKCIINFLI